MKVRDLILRVLQKQDHQTLAQLLPQLDVEWTHADRDERPALTGLTLRKVEATCVRLVYEGVLTRKLDAIIKAYRYTIPVARYRYAQHDGVWRILRENEQLTGMTEAEARICVTALNDMDRQVRKLRGVGHNG